MWVVPVGRLPSGEEQPWVARGLVWVRLLVHDIFFCVARGHPRLAFALRSHLRPQSHAQWRQMLSAMVACFQLRWMKSAAEAVRLAFSPVAH